MDDSQKSLLYLLSVEKLAEEILSDKREIIMLDKKRNENREALRSLTKIDNKSCWLTVGSELIKIKTDKARNLLETDLKQIDIDINKIRSELKVKVNKLRDLEMQPPVPGLMLVPISNQETSALSGAGLFRN